MDLHFGDYGQAEPLLEIVEQPKSCGYRFRYECEGGAHGNLYGANSHKSKKSFPSVKILNYNGAAQITVRLVTDEHMPRPHVHELIGKDCKNGMNVVELKPGNSVATFPGLAIKHISKKTAEGIITKRILESIKEEKLKSMNASSQHQVDSESIPITDADKEKARTDAQEELKKIDLNVVRLHFQGVLRDPQGNLVKALNPVTSVPVRDAKAPGSGALKICRMDKTSGCCLGEEEVFLLCDKVQKDDISVCFHEYDKSGHVRWEGYGQFGPHDVHRQFAIVFKTPAYENRHITEPVTVYVRLKRMTKDESSNEVPFTYTPEQQDLDQVAAKKRKYLPMFQSGGHGGGSFSADNSNYGASGGGGGGGQTSFPNISTDNGGSGFGGNLYQLRPTSAQIRPTSATQINSGQGYRQQLPIRQICPSPQQPRQQPQQRPQQRLQQVTQLFNPQILQPQFPQMGGQLLPDQMHSPLHVSPPPPYSPPHPPATAPYSPYENQSTYPMGSLSGRGITDPASPAAASGPPQEKPQDLRMKKLQMDCAPVEMSDPGYCGSSDELQLLKKFSLSDNLKTKLTLKSPDETKIEDCTQSFVEYTDQTEKKKEEPKVNSQQRSLNVKNEENEEALINLVITLGDRLYKALQDYATTGDVSYLLLVQRHLVAQQDDNGDNILHLAVIYKKLDVLRNLLKAVATLENCEAINQQNLFGQTPLHIAIISKELQMVELLVTRKCSITKPDRHGNSPIHLACKHSSVHSLKTVLLSRLLPHNDSSDSLNRSHVNKLNYQGMSPLHLAVESGNLDCVKALASLGKADVNVPDGKSGATPFHLAVQLDRLAILGFLATEDNAEVNAPDFSGATPLHLAVGQQNVAATAVLIAAGADPDIEILDEQLSDTSSCGSEDEDDCLSLKEKEKQRGGDKEKRLELDEDVDSDDDSDEDNTAIYVSARTMALGHKQLEQILNGEQFNKTLITPGNFNMSEKLLATDPQTYHSFMASNAEISKGQPSVSSSAGDLHLLDPVVRARLAQLLDKDCPGSDWRELAYRLELDGVQSDITSLRSPTKALLDQLEALDGTLDSLYKTLMTMKRYDAAKLIEDIKRRRENLKVTGSRVHQGFNVQHLEKRMNTLNL